MLQSSGSYCFAFLLYLFDCEELLAHLLLLEIRRTKAKSDPVIDEYREIHGSKDVVTHRDIPSCYVGGYFCILKRPLGKEDFHLLG